jgi:hypothetical protein
MIDPGKVAAATEQGKLKPGFELKLGTNSFRNTNGVIRIQGKEQVVIEITPDDDRLLLTMDFYDESGAHLAHLRRNAWAFNQHARFALTTSPASLSLFSGPAWVKVIDQHSGDTVLEVTVPQCGTIHVVAGKFFSHEGLPVEITSHYCRVGSGLAVFGEVFETRGGTAVIG